MAHILHIDSGFEMRGGQWQVLYLLEGLANGGHRVTLLARPGSPLFEKGARLGVEVKALSLRRIGSASRRADLTHVHDARSHTFAALLARQPLIVSRRVAFPIGGSPLSRWKYARPKHYLAVSRSVKQTLLEGGVNPRSISVVFDGVPIDQRQTPPDVPPRVIALDTQDPMKGRDLVERASASAKIPIYFSKDLRRDLEQASLFVYISRLEGLGSAALLAMAMGVPVVASRIGGLSEVIEHGRSGLLTDNQPEKIATAILQLTADRPFARLLAERARQRVENEFSVSRMVGDVVAVYQGILEDD